MWEEIVASLDNFADTILSKGKQDEPIIETYTVYKSKPIRGIVLELTSIREVKKKTKTKKTTQKKIKVKSNNLLNIEQPHITKECIKGDMMLLFIKSGYNPINGPFYYRIYDLIDEWFDNHPNQIMYDTDTPYKYILFIKDLCVNYLCWLQVNYPDLYVEIYRNTNGIII